MVVICTLLLAPELTDRILSDFMEEEEGIFINLHIKPVDQAKALKTVKRKITDLDAMKIQEQKRASRDGYDVNIIPPDLMAFGGDVKELLEELSNRNEKMFLLTMIIMNLGRSSVLSSRPANRLCLTHASFRSREQ